MEPEEKQPDPKYGKKQPQSPPLGLESVAVFVIVLKTGEEMETMSAGGRLAGSEGVDLTGLLQTRSHHHPRPAALY